MCGNSGFERPEPGQEPGYFPYRSSSYLTAFFAELGTGWAHDGSTRHRWVADRLEEILNEPQSDPLRPPELFCRLVDQLMAPADAVNEGRDRPQALVQLNEILGREGYAAFYGEDGHCYMRHLGIQTVAGPATNPHRPLSPVERDRRDRLAKYLDGCSEDELIEQILLPLFRQLGYHRVSAAGHRDKALEYGKDVWMRFHPAVSARPVLRPAGQRASSTPPASRSPGMAASPRSTTTRP